MSSLSFGPPGFNGRRRACGSGEACCEGAAEDAGGVGRLSVMAAMSMQENQLVRAMYRTRDQYKCGAWERAPVW